MSSELKVEASKTKARQAGESIVNHYTATAIWPSDKPDHIKSIILRMTSELTELYDRDIVSLSLNDIDRSSVRIRKLLVFSGVSKLRLSTIMRSIKTYDSKHHYVDMLSYLYTTGSAMTGNFQPMVRKLGLGVSGAPLARATGVWFVGQVLLELYYDEKGYEKAQKKILAQKFDPIFDSFDVEQLRELCCYLNLDPKVKWDEAKLRQEIFGVLANSYYNKVQGLVAEMPSYKNILLNLSSELELPEYSASDSNSELEEKIVRKIFAENINEMSPEKLEKYKSFVQANTDDQYWSEGVKAAALTGALVMGKRLSSGSLFLAGSSLLGSLATANVGFTSYSALSVAFSSLFGPASIGVSGIVLAAKLTKSRPRKAIPFVLYMAVMRSRLHMESQKKKSLWEIVKLSLKRLRLFFKSLKS